MEKIETPIPVVDPTSSIEVKKNSKGYNWSIKIYDKDPNKALDKMIEIELECQNKYGKKEVVTNE